jgi:hypothetical protein
MRSHVAVAFHRMAAAADAPDALSNENSPVSPRTPGTNKGDVRESREASLSDEDTRHANTVQEGTP